MNIPEIKDRLQVILIWKKGKFCFSVLDMGTSGNGSEGFSKTFSEEKDGDLLKEIYENMGNETSNRKFIAMYEYFNKITTSYKRAYKRALLDKDGKVR